MKKHDEGYVMVLVLVVILVLSIVSAALMSLGVTNMKSQRASIDRMQEKYTAQGLVEQAVARLSQGGKEIPLSNEVVIGDADIQAEKVETDLLLWLKDNYNIEPQDVSVATEIETKTLKGDNDEEQISEILVCKEFFFIVSGSAQSTDTRIDYTVKLSGDFKESVTQDAMEKTKYDMVVTDVAYTSYQIVTSSEGGGG